MKRHMRMLSVFLVAMVALILTAAAPAGWAGQIPFSIAKIIFEFNSSGQDLGIQVTLDGEPWNQISVKDPDGRTILEVEGSGRLRNFGLTELFAESNEPNFAEMSKEEILALFPEGMYRFFGKTTEGDTLTGSAKLTHDIPDGPQNLSPLAGAVVNPNNAVISWDAVTTPKGIKIVAYQVVVDGGNPSRRFDVTVPALPKNNRVTVPPEFLKPGTYNFEVLAIEKGGNQTITEGGPFETQ
jgi:hypothetical protein